MRLSNTGELFLQAELFGIEYTNKHMLFKKNSIVDFESICLIKERFSDTNTTKWIDKNFPNSVTISLNLADQTIFICNSGPFHLVASFTALLGNFNAQRTGLRKSFSLDVERTIKNRFDGFLKTLNPCHNRC